MINLRDGAYRLISMQFLITKASTMLYFGKTLRVEAEKTQNYDSSGELVILPQKNCTLSVFVSNLKILGYELVDAFLVERADGKYKARFVFIDHDHATGSDHFKSLLENINLGLMKLVYESMWQVRVWNNPFYELGKSVDGVRALSINMEQRDPLFLPDGFPRKVWQKDSVGNRVGISPVMLMPERALETDADGTIQVKEMLNPEETEG